MRAAVLQEPRQVAVVDVPEPVAEDGVLLRMRAVGLCGSDLHTWRGHHPFRKPPVVLGHEGAGEVVSSADPAFSVGDRVAVLPALSCWECTRCEAGHPHLCAAKRVPGGGWPGMLSEYFAAPARVLVPLADEIGYDEGALIEPLAVAWHCTSGGAVMAGDSVAVLGGGPIGSLVAAVSRIRGASTVLVSDVKSYNREFLGRQGVSHVVDPSESDLLAAGAALTGDGFDVVVVASGHPSCLAEAWHWPAARPRRAAADVRRPADRGSESGSPEGDQDPGLDDLHPGRLPRSGSAGQRPGSGRRPYITEMVALDRTPEVLTAIDTGADHLKIQIDPTR